MANFFTSLYLFFRKRKLVFYTFISGLMVLLIGLASHISFREDISGMTGKDSGMNKYEFVIRNFKFAEKLVIHIYQQDTLLTPDPDSLIHIANLLSTQLKQQFDSGYIRNLFTKADDSTYFRLINTVNDNLPLFLTEQDYLKIDSLLIPEKILKSLRKSYRTLLSPAGMVIRQQLLSDPLGIRTMGMQKLKTLQVDDNYIMIDGYVFSRNQKHLFIFLTPANPPSETEKNSRLIHGIDEISQALTNNRPGINIEYFGSIAVAAANARQLKTDIILTLTIAVFLIFFLVGWYFRSWQIPLLGFLPAIFGGCFALAILSPIKGSISSIALGIGSVILGLIIDYALYLINQYRQVKSVEEVLKSMSQTIVVCCLTSAGAFLCLIFLDSAVLHDLGWFAALSVTGAALFTLVILPHFLNEKLFPSAVYKKINLIDKIAAYDFSKNWIIIAIIITAGALGFHFSGKVGFDKDLSALNFMTEKLQKAENNLNISENSDLKNIYIVATGKTFEDAMKTNESIQKELFDLQAEKTIAKFSGIRYLLISDSLQQIRLSQWKNFWTDEKKSLLARILPQAAIKAGFKKNTFDEFFTWLDQSYKVLSKQDSRNFRNTFFSDWINEKPEMTMISSLVKAKAENKSRIYQAFSGKDDMIVFDRQNLTTRFVSGVKTDFDSLVRLSMIFVTLLLLLSFGRIETGLTTAVPMFLGWVITLGFMGIFGLTFNIFNIILSSFIFGLGVDYSILMMRGLMSDYTHGTSQRNTYQASIFLSSATTLIGVSVLFFAKHPALQSIALISVVGIISIVIITYTIQPLLTGWFMLNRQKRKTFPVTARTFFKTLITWGNIVIIAILMSVTGTLIYILFPVSRRKKESLFHLIFSNLCKLYIFITFPVNRKLINPLSENFSKPSVIISNHQSLIETPAFLRLTPKILILTNDWVFKSPVFGPIARLGGFINVENGLDANLEKLKIRIAEGYSILVFPEGHRSHDQRIARFHRGAFFLAEKLQIDILPIVVFGSGDFLTKGDFWGKPNGFRMKILPRISFDDPSYGRNYSERTKLIRKYYLKAYEQLKEEEGTAFYYRKKLQLNYVFKGPILEWYLRIKLKLENNYQIYHELLPAEGEILDLGCGYGYISYMLLFTSDKRSVTGVDYDALKISVASNCYSKTEQIHFICADISTFEITPKHGFLLGDVLHYLTPESQEAILRKCFSNLIPGGTILIREANNELQQRHQKSKLIEFLSTQIGFNQTRNTEKELFFTSASAIEGIAKEYGLSFETIDNKKITSNNLFLIRKNKSVE